jgi:hypothetical protein
VGLQMAGGVRLEHGKPTSSALQAGRPDDLAATAAIAIKFRCNGTPVRRKIMFADRKSGECRLN